MISIVGILKDTELFTIDEFTYIYGELVEPKSKNDIDRLWMYTKPIYEIDKDYQ